MAVINGINSKTIENMQLDAGVLIAKALDPESADFDREIKGEDHIGATKGAVTFSAIPEIRNIFEGIDGVRGDIKDGNVIDKWTVTLKATITEFTLANLQLCLGAGKQGVPGKKYTKIEPEAEINTSMYKSFTWLGTMAGGAEPLVIVLKNCLNVNGLTITAEDKNTGTAEIELKAHIDLANTEKQFAIYLPNTRTVLAASEAKELKLDK